MCLVLPVPSIPPSSVRALADPTPGIPHSVSCQPQASLQGCAASRRHQPPFRLGRAVNPGGVSNSSSSASRWPSRSSAQNRARFCPEASLLGRFGAPRAPGRRRGHVTARCRGAPCPGTESPLAARCHTRSHWRAASAQPRKIHIMRHLVAAWNQAPTTRWPCPRGGGIISRA